MMASAPKSSFHDHFKDRISVVPKEGFTSTASASTFAPPPAAAAQRKPDVKPAYQPQAYQPVFDTYAPPPPVQYVAPQPPMYHVPSSTVAQPSTSAVSSSVSPRSAGQNVGSRSGRRPTARELLELESQHASDEFAYVPPAATYHPPRKPMTVPANENAGYQPSWSSQSNSRPAQSVLDPAHHGYNVYNPTTAAPSSAAPPVGSASGSRPSSMRIDFADNQPLRPQARVQVQPQQQMAKDKSGPIVASYAQANVAQQKPQTTESKSRRHSSVPPRVNTADPSSVLNRANGKQQPTPSSQHGSPQRNLLEYDEDDMSEEARLYYSRKPRPVQYKPYTASDYRNINVPVKLGSLGPDLLNEELQERHEKAQRMREYARGVNAYNLTSTSSTKKAPPPQERSRPVEKTAREKAMEFAKNVPRPKVKRRDGDGDYNSSGEFRLPPSRDLMQGDEMMSELEKLEAQHDADVDAVEAIRREFMRS